MQYANYIYIIKLFITAEKVGDWHLNLYTTER